MTNLNELIANYNEVLESLNKDYRLVKSKFDSYLALGSYEDYNFKSLCLELGAVEAKITGIRKEMKEISKQFNTVVKDKEIGKVKEMVNSIRLKIKKVGA